MAGIPTEMDLAYIAGFFDGEGCISVSKTNQRKNGTTMYGLRVTVTNTELSVLEFIQSVLGGAIEKRHWNLGNRRQCYAVYWNAVNASRALASLLPFLRVKREEAELAVAFRSVMESTGSPGCKLSKLELDVREVFYQASKKLKEPVNT